MTYPASLSQDEQDFFTARERIRAKDYDCPKPDKQVPLVRMMAVGQSPQFIPGIYTKPKLVEPVLEWWA